MNTSQSVAQRTTVGAIGTLSRVFLATSIGLGAIASGFAFLAIKLPADNGGGSASRPALQVSYISNSIVVMDNRTTFQPMAIYAGPTKIAQQTSEVTMNAVTSTSSDQPVTIYLGTSSTDNTTTTWPYGFAGQILHIQYFNASQTNTNSLTQPKDLTVCIGANYNPRKVYVGADGSTYADSTMRNMTTSDPCPKIMNKALTLTGVSSARVATNPNTWPVGQSYDFRRGIGDHLATVGPIDFSTLPNPTALPVGPVGVTPKVNTSSTDVHIPATYVVLTGHDEGKPDSDFTLCMPSHEVPANSAQPITYYFAKDGTAYSDIFLTQLVVDYGDHFSTCAQAENQALKFSSIDQATVASQSDWTTNPLQLQLLRSGTKFGTIDSTGFFKNAASFATPPLDPLYVTPFISQNIDGTTYTLPQSMIQLVGKDNAGQAANATICMPEMKFLRTGTTYTISTFYYDNQGTPFLDPFFQYPAMTGTCSQVTSISFKPAALDSMTIQVDGTWPLSSEVHLSRGGQRMGTITDDLLTSGALSFAVPPLDPLKAVPFLSHNELGTSYTTPGMLAQYNGKAIDGTAITGTICIPALTFHREVDGDHVQSVFYDIHGTPYSDIFLQNPVMTMSCDYLQSYALKAKTITNATLKTGSTNWNQESYLFLRGKNKNLGSINPVGGFNPGSDTATESYGDPFVLSAEAQSGSATIIPSSTVTITGTNSDGLPFSTALCVPKMTVPGSLATPPKYYYDYVGNPYSDIFLQNHVSCSGPVTVGGSGGPIRLPVSE